MTGIMGIQTPKYPPVIVAILTFSCLTGLMAIYKATYLTGITAKRHLQV
jgi:hypothetical protein